MMPIDTSALSVAAQVQLSQLSLVSSEMGALEPAPSPFPSPDDNSLYSAGAYLDLSPEAQAYLTGHS